MNVSAATVGQPGLSAANALPLPPLAPALAPATDRVVSRLLEFSNPAIHTALQFPDNHRAADALIHKAGEALANHDIPRALHAVGELLSRQPDADIRDLHHPAVLQLMNRLTLEAKIDAHRTIAAAVPLIATHRMPHEAPAVLALASQFIETGQYVNYIRASQLGRLVISWSQPEDEPWDHAEQNIAHAVRRVTALWRRAPLLVLLMAWFLFGIVLVPLDADAWAIGFLALAGLQFVITLRNWPRPR